MVLATNYDGFNILTNLNQSLSLHFFFYGMIFPVKKGGLLIRRQGRGALESVS